MEVKRKLQRFLSIFLTCIMVFSAPMSILAAEDIQISDVFVDEAETAVTEEDVLSDEIIVEGETTAEESFIEEPEMVVEDSESQTGELVEIDGAVVENTDAFGDGEAALTEDALFGSEAEEETVFSAGEGETTEETKGNKLDTSNLTFDVAEPDGYVTISFTDNGVRPEGANVLDSELYGTPVGTIIGATEVPYVDGDSIADVTVRLFEAMELSYDHTGSVDSGFYLAALEDFELNDKYYATFGEFDAGSASGWCVRLNNWHINQGTSDFEVEDEDVISWLYTCQYGADVGADFSTKSAEITDVKLADTALALVKDESTGNYSCEVPFSTKSIAFEVELENYASIVKVTVDGTETKYRPNKPITVAANSTIVISTTLDYMDADNNNQITTYADSVTIQLTEKTNNVPAVREGAPTAMDAKVGKEIQVDLSTLFTDADNDTLSYHAKIAALNIDQDIEGTVFSGSIPAAGTYEVVFTATDGKDSAVHTVTLTVADNKAPNIKADLAETKSKTYVYASSYVYITMEDIFEDADGDTLTYEATLDGEKVDVTYNSYSKEHYIQFATKPVVREYKIRAYDGIAYSEEFTAKCIGTTATIKAAENAPLIKNGNYYYYIKGSAENDTFALEYTLDVEENLAAVWTSSNASVLTSNGDGTFTVGEVTSRQQPYVGVVCGKDEWGSDIYLGTQYLYILPGMPTAEDVTLELPEHADKGTPTTVSTVFNGWYSSEFDYEFENPSIADMTTYGSYGLTFTPKALGTTKVTATFKYDESIKCEFNVTVTGHSLQIKDQPGVDYVIYEDGKTVQMEVLGAQDGETFTWTSTDENVAAIDETGLVTIKGLGQTYITAVSSLSTEEKPVKASMYLQVKEEGKVYLDDLALTQYSYFGHISAKAGFNSAQLVYDWDLQESRYSYSTLQFTPYFDDENLTSILHYQVSGGEYQTMELTDEKAVSISNGLNPGENVVKIDVSPKDDEENITTYTFNIFRPYNPSKTINSMTIYPNGETALSYPTYKGYKEGTIYQWDTENNDFVAGWGGNPSTGWSSSYYNYKTFVFGSRTSGISVYPSLGYVNERVMIYVDGEPLEEAVHNWKSQIIDIDEDGVVITFHVNSEKYHTEQLEAGVEDPFTTPENVYTLYVENVVPLGIDNKILSAEISNGEFYLPGFTEESYTISGLIPADQSSTDLTFTVAEGIDVYKGTVSDANKLTAESQDEDGNNVYKTTLTITGTAATAYSTTNIILQVTDEETGETGRSQYAFTILRRGTKDIYPDSVEGYLCIGSQYTNQGNYGTMPERTLKAGGGTLSLGNFGGYIVYKYDTPIVNNPNNPYGVDFVIYGNSFGNGGHEPGYVQVSKDGQTWYTLAGSEHYEDHNDWGYTMTYSNSNGKSSWTNSDGESGTIYNYPVASAYPYYNWTAASEQSIAVSGYRLNSSAKDAYGSAAAVLPVFGYVDVNTNGTINGTSNNPYNHPGTLVAGGDQFDLDWAVDGNGMPVDLDSISYVRIATASSIYAGAIGEKSTEVSTMNRVTNTAAEAVGRTEAPAAIMVNGKEITVPENGGVLDVSYSYKDTTGTPEGEIPSILTIDVNAAEGSNVYINNAGAASRNYAAVPEKGIVRIIVQDGEKEPYICYLKLNHEHEWDEGTVAKAATCAETGEKLYTCMTEGCGATKAETISKVAHKYGSWTTTAKATVFKPLVQKRTCTVCKASVTRTVGNKLTPVLEVPGKLTAFNIKAGRTVKFKVTMANGDSIAAVKSNRPGYVQVSAYDKKNGTITLKGVKKGAAYVGIKLASGKYRRYLVKTVTTNIATTKVTVNNVAKNKLTLAKGKYYTLSVSKVPFTSTQAVTFTSSNKKIVNINSSGKMKAVAAGTARITVKSGTKYVNITVTVPKVKTTKITGLKSAYTLQKGKTYTLRPKKYPTNSDYGFSFTTSNKNVLTVNSKGVVTVKKAGTAIITVKSANVKFVIKVTVPKVQTTKITGLTSKLTITKGKTYTLKPKKYPANSDYGFTYKSSNTTVATVNSKGVITAKKAGKAKITVTSGTKSYVVTVTVK